MLPDEDPRRAVWQLGGRLEHVFAAHRMALHRRTGQVDRHTQRGAIGMQPHEGANEAKPVGLRDDGKDCVVLTDALDKGKESDEAVARDVLEV